MHFCRCCCFFLSSKVPEKNPGELPLIRWIDVWIYISCYRWQNGMWVENWISRCIRTKCVIALERNVLLFNLENRILVWMTSNIVSKDCMAFDLIDSIKQPSFSTKVCICLALIKAIFHHNSFSFINYITLCTHLCLYRSLAWPRRVRAVLLHALRSNTCKSLVCACVCVFFSIRFFVH